MAASWQTDHTAAVAQARIWIAQTADARQWPASTTTAALSLVDRAAVESEGWFFDDAEDFWTTLESFWISEPQPVDGWAEMVAVWGGSVEAAESGAEEGLQVDDLTEIISNPDADPDDPGLFGKIPGWVAPLAVATVVGVIVLRASS